MQTIEEEKFVYNRRLQLLKKMARVLDEADQEDGIDPYIDRLLDEYHDVGNLDKVLDRLADLKRKHQ
jgi:hypothetical protein